MLGALDHRELAGRRRGVRALRIVVSAGLLALLLSRVHLGSLLKTGDGSTLPLLVVALAVWSASILLATVRWQRVLAGLDLRSPLAPLLSHSLAGLFVANFLPSTVGGDVVRVVRLSADNGQGPGSFASVVLDRLTGFVVLPFLCLTGLLLHPSLLRLGTASRLAVALSLLTLLALVAIVGLTASPRLGGRLAARPNWLRFVGAVHLGLDHIRRRPAAAAAVLGAAVCYQVSVVAAVWVAAQALEIPLGWGPALAFVPAMAIAQVLPVSFGGLGLREGALVVLLAPLGVTTEQAIALGLAIYGLNLGVSLLGAPALAVGPREARALA